MGFFFFLGRTLFGRFNICALAGAAAGAITGFFFSAVQFLSPGTVFSPQFVLQVGLLFALFAWLVLLIFLGSWLGYGVGSVAVPTLVNSTLTSLLVVFVLNWLGIPDWGPLLGMAMGLLIGSVLCRFCGDRGRISPRRD